MDKENSDDWSLEDYQKHILDTSTLAAKDAITPYLSEDPSSGSIRIPWLDGCRYVSRDAPRSALNAAVFLSAMHAMVVACDDGDIDDATEAAFMAGLFATQAWLAGNKETDLQDLVLAIDRATEARKKGGENSSSLTPKQKDIAIELMRQVITKTVGKTPASVRVAATMKKKEGVDVSSKTILRHWNSSQGQN